VGDGDTSEVEVADGVIDCVGVGFNVADAVLVAVGVGDDVVAVVVGLREGFRVGVDAGEGE
jgi:hypothetical protein